MKIFGLIPANFIIILKPLNTVGSRQISCTPISNKKSIYNM